MSGWTDADLNYLRDAVSKHAAAEAGIRAEVAHLRQLGAPWSVIADVLGVSRQAAHERYRAARVSLTDEPLPDP